MASGGKQSPPPPPAAAASSEEEEEDGDAADRGQPAGSPSHQIQQRFEELCSRLNMDEAARAEAWSSYRNMSESYTLEVRAQTLRGSRGLGVALESLGPLHRTIASVLALHPSELTH